MRRRLALLLLCAVPTSAAGLTNKELLASCNSPPESKGDIACKAYLHGVFDGLRMASASTGFKYGFCPPNNLSLDEVQKAALGYIQLHPEALDNDAELASSMFLLEVYPCPNKN